MPWPAMIATAAGREGLDIGPADQPLIGGDAHQQLPVAIVGRLLAAGGRAIGLVAAQQDRLRLP